MLRIFFGVLGLVVVLAMLGSVAKNQLASLGKTTQTATRVLSPSGSDGAGTGSSSSGSMARRAVGGARLDGFAATAGAEMPSAQAQIQGLQQSVRDRTTQALQQGSQRPQP